MVYVFQEDINFPVKRVSHMYRTVFVGKLYVGFNRYRRYWNILRLVNKCTENRLKVLPPDRATVREKGRDPTQFYNNFSYNNENPKKPKDNTNKVGVTTAMQLVWLTRCTRSEPKAVWSKGQCKYMYNATCPDVIFFKSPYTIRSVQ